MRSSRNPHPSLRVFERSAWIDAPVEAVFAFHENPRNLEKISPPLLRLRRIEADSVARVGGRFRIIVRPLGLPLEWAGEWLVVERPAVASSVARLVDGAVRAPFAVFDHEHRFEAEGAGTRMTDRVTYAWLGPRWGAAGRLANWLIAGLVLVPMFRGRHATTRRWFARTQP